MNLAEVKLNTWCVVKSVDIKEENIKIRLMELGLIQGNKVMVKYKSVLKKTLLIVFNSSCFTLKSNVATGVVVNYA